MQAAEGLLRSKRCIEGALQATEVLLHSALYILRERSEELVGKL